MLIRPLQDVLLPHLTGKIVNAGGQPDRVRRLVTLLVGAIVVFQGLHMASELLDARIVPSLQAFYREAALRCVLRGTDGHLAEGSLRTGQFIAQILKGVQTMTYFFDALRTALPQLLVFIASAGYLMTVDVPLGLGALALVVLTLGVTYRVLAKCRPVSRERERAFIKVHDALDDVLHNVVHVHSSAAQEDEVRAVTSTEDLFSELHAKTVVCTLRPQLSIVLPITVVFIVACLARCSALVRADALTMGEFVSVLLVLTFLMQASIRVAQQTKTMSFHLGTTDASVGEVLATCPPERVLDRRGLVSHSRDLHNNSSFGLHRVTFGVLRDVTLTFEMGERTVLLGPVGSGKSTVLSLLAWLVTPEEGYLHIGGVMYDAIGRDDVRAQIAYVPQTPTLFDRSLLDNILYGTDADEEDAQVLAAELGAQSWIARLPQGLRTMVSKGGSRLSGGQRQVVLLMRALLSRKRLVLLDEPTSAMDDSTRNEVAAALLRVDTAVIVTHDLEFAKTVSTAQRIILPIPQIAP